MNKKRPRGKKEKSAPQQTDWKALEIMHPDAAGIDIGGSEHWVAISPERDPEPVRCLAALRPICGRWRAGWSRKAFAPWRMQSTGVYWMPVFEIFEQHGLEVYLVNAQHTKNVPGRKSDVQECQWLLKLHAFGLLNNSFQPTDEIRIARTVVAAPRQSGGRGRQCDSTDAESPDRDERAVQHRAERPQWRQRDEDHRSHPGRRARSGATLAALVEPEVKATPEDIAKSLEGNWREELLFVLRQEVELYRHLSGEDRRLRSRQLREHLESLAGEGGSRRRSRSGPSPRARRQQERTGIRSAERVVSHYGNRLGADERHRCADGADRDHRGWRRPKRVSKRKTVRQLAGTVLPPMSAVEARS